MQPNWQFRLPPSHICWCTWICSFYRILSLGFHFWKNRWHSPKEGSGRQYWLYTQTADSLFLSTLACDGTLAATCHLYHHIVLCSCNLLLLFCKILCALFWSQMLSLQYWLFLSKPNLFCADLLCSSDVHVRISHHLPACWQVQSSCYIEYHLLLSFFAEFPCCMGIPVFEMRISQYFLLGYLLSDQVWITTLILMA